MKKMSRALACFDANHWMRSLFSNARSILSGSSESSLTYAAGELKHGTISLVENGSLIIGVLTQRDRIEKTVSNMAECKARGAYLMGLTGYGNYNVEEAANFTVYVPNTDPHFIGSIAIIPLQLLAYYTSVAKGLDVDKPRNLAKSVTVE